MSNIETVIEWTDSVEEKGYSINKYNKIKIRVAFTNGGYIDKIIDTAVIKLFDTISVSIYNASPSGISNYYGCCRFLITSSKIQMLGISKGSGIDTVSYTVTGIY